MKASLRILLVVTTLFVCAWVQAESIRSQVTPTVYKKGIVWRIESNEQKVSYLMGTMHVNHPGIWKLFKRVQGFFDQSKVVCTEVKLDFETMAAEMQATFFHDGRTLKTVINDPVFYQLVVQAARERGLPEPLIKNMKPFTLVFMLSMPPSQGEMLDQKIYQDAILKGKQSCALETVKEHSTVLDVFSMADQIDMLKSTVSRIDEVKDLYPVLLDAYLSSDLVEMARLVNGSLMMEDPRIEKIFLQKFLIDRNKKMVERMIPRIKKGKAFFAVGAMHLTGSAGILRLLSDQGYKLTAIY